jgi:hypothetical protein
MNFILKQEEQAGVLAPLLRPSICLTDVLPCPQLMHPSAIRILREKVQKRQFENASCEA